MSHPFLNAETLDVSMTRSEGGPPPRVVTLTIAHHSDPQRVGERARFAALGHSGSRVPIARAEPSFRSADAGSSEGAPLLSPFVSRKPLVLEGLGGGATRIDARSSGSRVEVDGEAVTGRQDLPADALERGVVLQVGSHVVLILHSESIVDTTTGDSPAFSRLVGESDAMQNLRAAIARVAADTRPVLLRGETGTGKELVAAALHDASPRRRQPFVAVNMAAVPQTLAASALFGHTRGPSVGRIRPTKVTSCGRTAARSSSTRSGTRPWRCRPRSFECSRPGRSCPWADAPTKRWTCVWSRPPTRTSTT